MIQRTLIGLAAVLLLFNMATAGDPDQKDLQGTWTVLKVIENGKPEPESQTSKFKMIFKDNTFAIEQEGKDFVKGTFKLDSGKTPKEIDFKIEKAPNMEGVGKTATGIYKIEGDMLIWCATKPGEGNRPTALTAEAGSGRMMITLKKAKS